MSGTLLLYVALWLLAKYLDYKRNSNNHIMIVLLSIIIFRPNSSLPFHLISPLQLVIVVTCALMGLLLVLVSFLGLWVALKQTRISTGLVSHLYVFISTNICLCQDRFRTEELSSFHSSFLRDWIRDWIGFKLSSWKPQQHEGMFYITYPRFKPSTELSILKYFEIFVYFEPECLVLNWMISTLFIILPEIYFVSGCWSSS